MRFNALTFLWLLFFCLGTASGSGQAVEKRVLFVVETSKDTKALAAAERKVITALIQTGLGGLLETNDSFGIWTYSDTLHFGKYPVQRWSKEDADRLAQRADDFLKAQLYDKIAKIDSIRQPLQTVIDSSPALMVVLVTSGKQPIAGTPFDNELNADLKDAARELQKKKSPAVVLLSSTSGRIRRYSVNPAIGDVRVPLLTVPTNQVTKVPPAPPLKKPTPPAPAPVVVPPVRSESALVITKGGAQTVPVAEANQIAEAKPFPTPSIPTNALPGVENEIAVLPPQIISTTESTEKYTTQAAPAESQAATGPATPAVEVAVSPKPSPPPGAQTNTLPAAPKGAESAPSIPVPTQIANESAKPVPAVGEAPQATVVPAPASQPVVRPAIAPVQETAPAPAVSPSKETAVSSPVAAAAPAAQVVATASAPTPTVSPVPTVTAPEVRTAEVQPVLAQTTTEPKRSSRFLMAAAGLIVLAIGLAFLIGRQISQKPQQSLVSDWAERDRLKKD